MTKQILRLRPSAAHHCGRRVSGFTLIELMISVSIMAIIMLAFGGLLTRANQVVTEGERRMRSDAAASAIARIIRNDIRKITKNGFFRIGKDVLVIVTAGKTQSAFSDKSGDGSIIVYGYHDASKVLYRKVMVLAKDAPTAENQKIVDCLIWKGSGINLAELQIMSADTMKEMIDEVEKAPDSMAYPPQTLHQVTKTMWMVLAGGCKELLISHRASDDQTWSDSSGTHTRHNQTSWPTAIKFNFTLQSDSLVGVALTDESNAEVNYEIVCPVGH
ncbi:MAG: prepilin-type N-terminal cleavage/methylation domain-containing protein [Phycisphaerae bacterium]|jgi:prepilin-type N-terminal cleavage/methylation domain-containing protein|nr:prepilin-type N-terminal cleavage/methylation domain-containing protein [Phycisphaerae bacterium]